jgi:OFA family oxalate/formate antiporter-like MFS transporter
VGRKIVPKTKPVKARRFYYGWVIVAVVALAGFTQSAETFPVLSVFLKPITADFGWSRSVFTAPMTIGTLLGGLIAIGIGPLIDRFGPRWILVVGFFILGSVLILMAQINDLWQFYLLQILGRMMTMGVIAMATQVIIPKWFISKRGRAVALGQLGGRAGNAITPLYAQFLITHGSWRLAAAVSGIVVWGISLLPSAIFLRRRPEDMSLLPDGVTSEDALDKESESTRAKSITQERSLNVKQVIHLKSFYLIVASLALMSFFTPALHLHMIPYLTDLGINDTIAVTVMALSSVSGALGSLGFGFIAERLSIRLMMVVAFILLASSYLFLLTIDSTSLALMWGIFVGISQGGIFTLQQIIFADYYGRDSLGAIRGIVWPIQLVFNSFVPLVTSMAYDITGGYRFIFSIFAVMALISGMLILLAQPPRTRVTEIQTG